MNRDEESRAEHDDLDGVEAAAVRDEDEPDSNNTDSLSEDAQAGYIRPDQVAGRQLVSWKKLKRRLRLKRIAQLPVDFGTNGHGTLAIINAEGEAIVADTNIALGEEGLGMAGRQFYRAHVRGGVEYEEEQEEEEDVDASSSHAEFPWESENPDRWIEEHLIESDLFESSEES